MLSLQTFFWIMITFFSLVGFLRGWTREIIATSGLVLSLFALHQFGPLLISLVPVANAANYDTTLTGGINMRQQFYVLSLIHLTIAFFSYQGPTLASAISRERLAVRVRESLQEKLLGAVVGGLNGYLIIGTLWSLLEYQFTNNGYFQLPPGIPYAFNPASVIRSETVSIMELVSRLPLPMLSPFLPILIVVVFLFVIVVMI